MKLRINPTIYNDDKTRKKALNEVKKPIADSPLTKASRKLFKVKHADNDILFNNPDDPNRKVGGHYTLTVGVNPNTDDVAVAIITSLEDKNGNPVKQDQIAKGLIYPLKDINGLSRKSGVKQEVITKNKYTNENIKYSSLQEPNQEISLDNREKAGIGKFLYSSLSHKKGSERNNRRTKNYIKIK